MGRGGRKIHRVSERWRSYDIHTERCCSKIFHIVVVFRMHKEPHRFLLHAWRG